MNRYTVSEHCTCGAAVQIDADSHHDTWASIRGEFLTRHQPCTDKLGAPEEEDLSRREVDMGASIMPADEHSQPEMQVGFSRQWMDFS